MSGMKPGILPDMPMTATERITDIGVRLFKDFMNKIWYPFLTRRLDAHEVVFLNYGYEEDPPMGMPLDSSDEPNRCGIQLYHRVATQTDLEGKKVLEVSCGHGGGASYLTRTLHPASYTGLDFNPDGVAYCKKTHKVPGLDFVHGNAEDLPFPNESFDAIINVEASHAYPQLSRFLAEVARVLRPGGYFLYTDFRGDSEFPGWEGALAEMPLRQVSVQVINDGVIRSLDKNSERSLELIGGRLPSFMRPFGKRFAGVPGTAMYRGFENGTIEYRVYSFIKD
jgi:SAM-dependent methyltransferase